MKNICVVGLGFVGLTLAAVLAERGFKVYGVEVNANTVEQLKNCRPHFHERGLSILLRKHVGKNLFISTTMPSEKQDAFIISVGTPIDEKTKDPKLGYIINSSESVRDCIQKSGSDNCLIILRSTVPVGVSRNVVKPIMDGLNISYSLAFCPERTIEGRALQELQELPQVVGGIDEKSVTLASSLFRKVTPTIIEVSSLEAAEMIKIVNNSYRDVLFAYANEIALTCEKIKLDPFEVIKAANLGYKRSAVPIPGFVGGACLTKDSYILAHSLKEMKHEPKLIMGARQLNETLPGYIVEKATKKILQKGKDIATAKILVSGIAFKGVPPTDDIRDSPTLKIIEQLKSAGCRNIFGHDFLVPAKTIESLGIKSCDLEEGFSNADCAIIANNHPSYQDNDIDYFLSIMSQPAIFLDCWQQFDKKMFSNLPNIDYGGIGFE